ncbi:MAG: formylglycine-generating enzyme family protein [Planctomycetota bacterium]|nr:formylglycine-generating enzyme family protein [Planctomycetota bacterium]
MPVVVTLALCSLVPCSCKSSKPEKILDLGKGVTMKLAVIRAGTFTMGSPEDEADRRTDEGPPHAVTISKPFCMGMYEVTQEQYEAVTGRNPSTFKGKQNPVENVSWDDAVEFCKKLSQKTGKTVRLPTEAQWEYACRAGSKTAFSYGDDADYRNLGDYAWNAGNSGGSPHPVGGKKPNAWGLYDMHGNVWEWCADWYAESYVNPGALDPQGPGAGTGRVLRGGGWIYHAPRCRSAHRDWGAPDLRDSSDGFRVITDSD